MKKLDTIIKLPNTTMYFSKVQLTYDEISKMYVVGHVPQSWLRHVLDNVETLDAVLNSKPKRLTKKQALANFINDHKNDRELWNDIKQYGNGLLDSIDLSVKYGIYYKDLKRVFSECFSEPISSIWASHKKHSQRKTSQQLYGVSNPSLDPEIIKKKKQTMIDRYGVDHNMKSDVLAKRHRESMIKKYGVLYAFELGSAQCQWYNLLFNHLSTDEKWGNTLTSWATNNGFPNSSEMFSNLYGDIRRRDFAMSYGRTDRIESLLSHYKLINGHPITYPSDTFFKIPVPHLFSKTWLKFYGDKSLIDIDDIMYQPYSQYERLVMSYLDSADITYIANNRTLLDGYELDFYLPDYGIAIECNPNKTHNSNKYATSTTRVMFSNQTKSKSYHYQKYCRAKNSNIILIQWSEQDLEFVQFSSITWPRFITRLKGANNKIGARKVDVTKSSDPKATRSFIAMNHARQNTNATEYWDFSHNGELVGAASFVIKNDTAELKRLCFAPNTQILGGISKLIKSFFRAHTEVQTITTFSDNDLGDGKGYERAGAQLLSETGPSLKFVSWSDPSDTYSWQIATKWGAKSGVLAKLSDNKNFVNQQEIDKYIELDMPHKTDQKCGYDRIYTSGSKKWQFTR